MKKILLKDAQDIDNFKSKSNVRDDNSLTAPSTTAEHKTVGVQFQIISDIVDNITASEDQKGVDVGLTEPYPLIGWNLN